MTLTTKSQMTLPKQVREDLGVGPGDKIDIVKQAGQYVLLPRNLPIASLAGILGKSPAGSMSVDEEEAALEEALTVEDRRLRAGR